MVGFSRVFRKQLILLLLLALVQILTFAYFLKTPHSTLAQAIASPCDLSYKIESAIRQGLNEVILPGEECLLDEPIELPANFNLQGTPGKTAITVNKPIAEMIKLISSVGTIGNNNIKGIILKGNGLVDVGIRVSGRSKVTIEDVVIEGIRRRAIYVSGGQNWEPLTIDTQVYNECPDFDLTMDFTPRDNERTDEIYNALKSCPQFPTFVPQIAKEIRINNVIVRNSFLDNLEQGNKSCRYCGLIEAELVHGIEISNSDVEGKNVYGIKVYWWGTNSRIVDNRVRVSVGSEGENINPALGIEIWHKGFNSEIRNNNVSRWISVSRAHGSSIIENKVEYTNGKKRIGIEVGLSNDVSVVGNIVSGMEIGVSVDHGTKNVVLEGNLIKNSTRFGIWVLHGISVPHQNLIIRDNLIDKVGGYTGSGPKGIGVFFWPSVLQSIIEKNEIKNTDRNSVYLRESRQNIIRNNLFSCYNKDSDLYGKQAVALDDVSKDNTVENNRVVECNTSTCNNNDICEEGETIDNCPSDCSISCRVADLNCDGKTNLLDLLHWRKLSAQGNKKADLNKDGNINLLDYIFLLQELLKAPIPTIPPTTPPTPTPTIQPTPTKPPSPTPVACNDKLLRYRVRNRCRKPRNSYREFAYVCENGTRGILGPTGSCKSIYKWQQEARAACCSQ